MSRHAAPGPVVIDIRGWVEGLTPWERAASLLVALTVTALLVVGLAAFLGRDVDRLADPSTAGPLERAQAQALARPTSFPPGQRVFHDRHGFGAVTPHQLRSGLLGVAFDVDHDPVATLARIRWVAPTALLAVTPEDEQQLIALHRRRARQHDDDTTP